MNIDEMTTLLVEMRVHLTVSKKFVDIKEINK